MALTLGTGFGSGFVAAGRLLTDAPEVPADGWVYCLPFEGGIADDAFSTRWFCRRYKALTGREVAGVKEVAGRAGTETEARQVFEEYGRRLGEFILPVFDRFRGDVLVLGGNIARHIRFSVRLSRGGWPMKGESSISGCHRCWTGRPWSERIIVFWELNLI